MSKQETKTIYMYKNVGPSPYEGISKTDVAGICGGDYIHIAKGECVFIFEEDESVIVAAEVAAIERQIEEARAYSHIQITALENRIQSLLSISHESAEDEQ